MTSRIAVLASGGGSNLQAILDHFDALGDRRAGSVVVVGSHRSTAGVLERAERRAIPSMVISPEARGSTDSIDRLIDEYRVDFIVLAGYLKMIPADIVSRFDGRMVNVHPALLPAFGGHGMYGNRVHHAVIQSGARVSGVTVHFVDAEYDHGAIIAQWPVPVFADDDAGTLAARVLRVEHILYPRVIDALAAGRMSLPSREPTVISADTRPAFTLLPKEDSRLAENIDLALAR
ncbi:MAG TPA: phosphoribosylglycinamide formyltransferase [Gemmatimonadaceae bacterium]|jgi:formyltetrahydrofolate-dependent phosphoribosylglycinamide formyltransferase|nr:phosphoribosylglycinamide formyltransferase [Gemmatimonadaceae bacterium]